jgi:hypothetical protein
MANLIFQEILKEVMPQQRATVRQRLHDKYVLNNTWSGMNDEEREDAAHAATMIFAQKQPDYHVYSVAETKAKRSKIRQKLSSF